MGSFSGYLCQKLLDHVFKTASYSVPTNICIGLSTADPGEDGAGLAEPSGNGYARVTHNSWDAATGNDPAATENTGAATFPTATGSWGNCTHFCIFDAAAAGNLLGSGALDTAKTITNGDTPKFNDGAIDVTLD
jgi:hypothetical protein